MLKHTKQFIKGFKEGYESDHDKTKEPKTEIDERIISEILAIFEKEVPERDVWEIYEDFEHWLIFSRPKDGGINLQPNFVLSKSDRRVRSVSFSKDELAYGMRKPPIYKRESVNSGFENNIYECLRIAFYDEEILEICDTVMRVDVQVPIIGDRDRDEIGVRYSGEILKGEIEKNDALEMISCDLQKGRTVAVDHIEIRNILSEKTAVIFSFENHDDISPVYFVKIADSKRKEFYDLLETIQKDIES